MFLSLRSLTVSGILDKTGAPAAVGRQGLEDEALATAFTLDRQSLGRVASSRSLGSCLCGKALARGGRISWKKDASVCGPEER